MSIVSELKAYQEARRAMRAKPIQEDFESETLEGIAKILRDLARVAQEAQAKLNGVQRSWGGVHVSAGVPTHMQHDLLGSALASQMKKVAQDRDQLERALSQFQKDAITAANGADKLANTQD
jgi:hypothetical protein